MKRHILLIIGIVFGFSVAVTAQDNSFLEPDSLQVSDGFLTFPDSLSVDSLSQVSNNKVFIPNPTKAVLYSAVFPGLGQIYNRKYWKLPLVYGAFTGCIYAITWNDKQYKGYKNAYVDFTDGNAGTASWKNYENLVRYSGGTLTEEPEQWSASAYKNFSDRLNTKKYYFRRYLELSYIISVGVYVLCMLDAYVDAQLFEFDINEELSLKIDPVIFERTPVNSRTFGLQCSITF